jgi:crotonobetainyl-CoA:carnitine CoA-transferase CaiB-like acyl-CoA transferase
MLTLLEGVRVLECAVLFNGDHTGRILADLGADVIKIEAPPVGDYLRDFLGQIAPHHSPAHMYVNRNKRSVTANLRSDEGRELFFRLLETADIFVDGFAGNACERLGIGYEAQRAVKPDIVYAQCSGFGAHGPYAQVPTHGQMMGALGGGAALRLRPDGLVDDEGGFTDGTVVGASYTALTAIAALQQRNRTGEGAYIDGAGSDAVLATQWFQAVYAWNDHRLTDRRGMASGEGRNPKYHFYATKDDRFILFCGIEAKFWENFCRAIDRLDLLGTHDTSAPVDFRSGGDDLVHELAAIFRTRTQAEWVDIAVAHDIAMGPAHRPEDLPGDPHLQARGVIDESVHPIAGPFTAPGWPAPVQGQVFEVDKPAPTLGQHQEEVFGEIGVDTVALAALRERGVI